LTLDGANYADNDVKLERALHAAGLQRPLGQELPGVHKGVTDVDAGFVWVISAGPNETLETSVTSPILNDQGSDASSTTLGLSTSSDDIGKMMFKARDSVLGVSN
ncbi:MAG: hypothetical protein ACUZ8A_05615, partial [Candidatus Bathyanammoxibius sp.]